MGLAKFRVKVAGTTVIHPMRIMSMSAGSFDPRRSSNLIRLSFGVPYFNSFFLKEPL